MSQSTTNRFGMSIFAMDNLDLWQGRIVEAAIAGGAGADRKGSTCRLWMPDHIQSIAKRTLRYVEGVKVVRESVGYGLNALGIIPHRFYFEEGGETPTSTPEWQLVGDRKPRLPTPTDRIVSCLEWAGFLAERVEGFYAQPMPVSSERYDLHTKTSLVFRNGAKATAGAKVSNMLSQYGFFSAPENLYIDVVAPADLQAPAENYRNLLVSALRRCNCSGTVALKTYEEMTALLRSKSKVRALLKPGYCVLVQVLYRKGNPLTPDAQALIADLTAAHIPFRMFSANNPALKWAALDQIGSLLAAAGGIPYILELPWPREELKPFILGVDLGHPLDQRRSPVVFSLVDHRGIHLESWRYTQHRDETIDPAVLKQGLTWALQAAQKHSGTGTPDFLVVRDGRLNKWEPLALYFDILGHERTTFVEFTKYNNPEMYLDGDSPSPAPGGSECRLQGADCTFLTPVSPRLANDLSRTFKVRMKETWDGLGLGADALHEILVGLSYSSALGLAHHALPAPIYWADGIAAIGETNHQFAGQRIEGDTGLEGEWHERE